MEWLYISEEGYLCQDVIIYDYKTDNEIKSLTWKPIWFKQIKYKVWKDWLFTQVI